MNNFNSHIQPFVTLWSFYEKCSKIYLGNIQRELKLNFEEETEVYRSCGATLNGQHWIIGGMREKRQVSD